MKKVFFIVGMLLIVINSFGMVFSANNFTDLNSSHWAYKAVSKMTQDGVITGYPDGSFMPSKDITRAEFAKLLVLSLKLSNNNLSSIYIDVRPNHWAYKYVSIISEYMPDNSNEFNPDVAMTREQVSYVVVKAMKLDNEKYNSNTINKFSDKGRISSGYEKYISIVAEKSIMNGNADGTFNPLGGITRAEIAQLLYNISTNLGNTQTTSNAISISINMIMNNKVLLNNGTYKVKENDKINVSVKGENATVNKIQYYFDDKNNTKTINASSTTITIPGKSGKDSITLNIGVDWKYSNETGVKTETSWKKIILKYENEANTQDDTSKSSGDKYISGDIAKPYIPPTDSSASTNTNTNTNTSQTTIPNRPSDIKKSTMVSYKDYTLKNGNKFSFWLYTPEIIREKMPVIVFWHGDGEIGKGLSTVKNNVALCSKLYKKELGVDAIVIIPNIVSDGTKTANNTMSLLNQFISGEFTDKSGRKLVIDSNRMAIMGFSRGAIHLERMSSSYVKQFKVFVFISAFTNSHAKNFASANAVLCIWGKKDMDPAPKMTSELAKKINKAGGKATTKVVSASSHGSVLKHTFSNSNVLDWVMSKM